MTSCWYCKFCSLWLSFIHIFKYSLWHPLITYIRYGFIFVRSFSFIYVDNIKFNVFPYVRSVVCKWIFSLFSSPTPGDARSGSPLEMHTRFSTSIFLYFVYLSSSIPGELRSKRRLIYRIRTEPRIMTKKSNTEIDKKKSTFSVLWSIATLLINITIFLLCNSWVDQNSFRSIPFWYQVGIF